MFVRVCDDSICVMDVTCLQDTGSNAKDLG